MSSKTFGTMHAGIRRQTYRILDIVMVDDGLEWIGVDRDGLRRQRSTHLFYLNEPGAGETRGA
ncbi:hypothetical protein X738_23385 [Mesorhizobium sp. LNHC209A00]|nr:hypothetical protein X738_23385 [Mesorhizobium sp. LNHC209A00]ESY95495.1 hypothetical protein X741_08430 [Mesorhizobium sp. LNHC229A00]